MTKLNISVPQELLDEIDTEASALGLTRSGLIQEASARYITQSRGDRAAEVRRLRIETSARRMREVGEKLGLRGADPVALLAEARTAQESRRES